MEKKTYWRDACAVLVPPNDDNGEESKEWERWKRNGWRDRYNIENIARLCNPTNRNEQDAMIDDLKMAIESGQLAVAATELYATYIKVPNKATDIAFDDSVFLGFIGKGPLADDTLFKSLADDIRYRKERAADRIVPVVAREEFRRWLGAYGLELLPDDAPVRGWLECEADGASASGSATGETESLDWLKSRSMSKGEKQDRAILACIENFGWQPMEIPDRGKKKLMEACQSHHLFGELFLGRDGQPSPGIFDTRWSLGIGLKWRMKHHESYARLGTPE